MNGDPPSNALSTDVASDDTLASQKPVRYPWSQKNITVMTAQQNSGMAPPVPESAPMIFPEPSPDAPRGHMKTLPDSENIAAYIERKREKLRVILQNREDRAKPPKRSLEIGQEGRGFTMDEIEFLAAQPKRLKASIELDFSSPKDFPRDEYGIQIGNYHEGVKFIRDAIRQCGGAVPLDRLETRIGATKELKENIGNIRQFLDIHDITFTVTNNGKDLDEIDDSNPVCLVVSLRGESPGQVDDTPTFQRTLCPDCGLEIKGLVLPRHRGSRICISVQLMRGCEGDTATPIMRLGSVASYIKHKGSNGIDDGDVDDFAHAIDEASNVPKFRYSSCQQFNHLVLSAIRIVRKKWSLMRGKTFVMDIIPFREDDRSFIHFFQSLGRSIKRLPLLWIDMGEIEDMCANVLMDLKPFLPAPPRAADPEIAPTNEFPGLLFADETLNDEDEVNSEVEIEYSDDEANQYEFVSMASMSQLIMTAGCPPASNEVLESLVTQKPLIAENQQNMIPFYSGSDIFTSTRNTLEVQEIKQRILSESSMVKPSQQQKSVAESNSQSPNNVSFF